MSGGEKRKSITGTCRFCGQTSLVEADTEAEANAIASKQCSCGEGEAYREKEACLDRIEEICRAPKEEAGVMPLTFEEARLIRQIADRVAISAIDGASIDIKGTVIRLKPGTEKKPVKFGRSWKLEIEN